MQPDGAGFRPLERLGEKTQALAEMGSVFAVFRQANCEVQDNEWKAYVLCETVEEQCASEPQR
jgi:hypothetical protein